MRSFKHILVGLISLTLVLGGVALVTPPTEEAQALLSFGGCETPPTWKGPIPGKLRFVPTYFDKHGKPHAYCDRQTGIVIQGTPGVPPNAVCGNTDRCTWDEARFYCANLTVGDSGQKGWRLLYIQELAALVDLNSTACTGGADSICLPDGHPFKNVQSGIYWSASTDAVDPTVAWTVTFIDGDVGNVSKNGSVHAWCGRGASAADAY